MKSVASSPAMRHRLTHDPRLVKSNVNNYAGQVNDVDAVAVRVWEPICEVAVKV